MTHLEYLEKNKSYFDSYIGMHYCKREFKHFFVKGHKYHVYSGFEGEYWVSCDLKSYNGYWFNYPFFNNNKDLKFSDYFLTLKEERNIKLKKLKNEI